MNGAPFAFAVLLIVHAPTLEAQAIERVREHFAQSRFDDVRREVAALEKAAGPSAEAAYWLGRVEVIGNRSDVAMDYFDKAVTLAPSNAEYHFWLGSAVRDVTPYASKIRMPFHARKMKKSFERAVELDPSHIQARFGLVQYYASAPGAMGGDKRKAETEAQEIGKRNAMRGAIAQAFIAEMREDVAAQDVAWRTAIAAAPDSAAGYEGLAVLLATQKRPAEALAVIEQYARRQPDDPMVKLYVGRVSAIASFELERGKAALEDFLKAPPPGVMVTTLATAHYRLGQICAQLGDDGGARSHYTNAVKLNPHSPAKKALAAKQEQKEPVRTKCS
jgi:tetratricopeptide (TPR) repeat protein